MSQVGIGSILPFFKHLVSSIFHMYWKTSVWIYLKVPVSTSKLQAVDFFFLMYKSLAKHGNIKGKDWTITREVKGVNILLNATQLGRITWMPFDGHTLDYLDERMT